MLVIWECETFDDVALAARIKTFLEDDDNSDRVVTDAITQRRVVIGKPGCR